MENLPFVDLNFLRFEKENLWPNLSLGVHTHNLY